MAFPGCLWAENFTVGWGFPGASGVNVKNDRGSGLFAFYSFASFFFFLYFYTHTLKLLLLSQRTVILLYT